MLLTLVILSLSIKHYHWIRCFTYNDPLELMKTLAIPILTEFITLFYGFNLKKIQCFYETWIMNCHSGILD